MTDAERELRKEVKNLRSYLKLMVDTTEAVIAQIDAEMKKPSDARRGGRIADLVGALELDKDRAKRWGLCLDFDGKPLPKPGKKKKPAVRKKPNA